MDIDPNMKLLLFTERTLHDEMNFMSLCVRVC